MSKKNISVLLQTYNKSGYMLDIVGMSDLPHQPNMSDVDFFKVFFYSLDVFSLKNLLINYFVNVYSPKYLTYYLFFFNVFTQNFTNQLFFQCFSSKNLTYQLFFDFSTSKNCAKFNWNHQKMTKNDLKTSNIT